MEAGVAVRQLLERGPLPRTVVTATGAEIVPDPSDPERVMLRAERDLLARVAAASEQSRAVPWPDLTVCERLLFRQQHARLNLKRLKCGSVYPRGRHGARCRRELLSLISGAKGGIDCFVAFAEYPAAHADVLDLIKANKVVTVATTLWATQATRRQNSA